MENNLIDKPIIQCSNCVLDSGDDSSLSFNEKGVCNYCVTYYQKYGVIKELAVRQEELQQIINSIKEDGKSKKYDALLGVSGGVDSTYMALRAKEFGLRVLLVHFDNGWNSELAVSNIENIVNKTGFDLYTYVVNWDEFKDLQLSYIKAGVLDLEIPTDHGFIAVLYKIAYKYKIKHILTGHNFQTESILPKSMRWSKMDVANITDIHKTHGSKKLETFKLLGFARLNFYKMIMKFKFHNLLEFMDYNKEEVKSIITSKLGWRDYGGKHYESIFTRFYQGYILPVKFGVDKRKAHLSNLICSGQMTKEQALLELQKPAYEEKQLQEDRNYFLKKLGLSENEFEKIMAQKPVSHLNYKSYETGLYRKHENFMQFIRPITKLLKIIKVK